MNRLFGTHSNTFKPNINDVISSTEQQIQNIEKKIDKYTTELVKLRQKLKSCSSGSSRILKSQALTLLHQKKIYEQQKMNLQQQLLNMEQTVLAADQIKNTAAIITVMKSTNKTFQGQRFKLNEIEKIQDNMEDLLNEVDQANCLLARSYDLNQVDETELEAEFEALEEIDLEIENGIPSYLEGIEELNENEDKIEQDEVTGLKEVNYV
ncbi:hypothetical protein PNEG_01696 [Pneumocystis murina B123]|uniref:Charged multivesicular body protein 5 n=1 Tax=Pneumocystis murina (strain B123) TaxID=1069680 RepID=M7NRN3_PNEMU|nr:hypothetical protein PNEG_01696 [Pneumocystis murina B123]EMR09937.1 hypothetical protein PNEG_01696 [Pneumocystis murina B123]